MRYRMVSKCSRMPPDLMQVSNLQAHGTVLSCRVLYDHNNRSKQVAFVQMETHQQAQKSIEALHSTQVKHFSFASLANRLKEHCKMRFRQDCLHLQELSWSSL